MASPQRQIRDGGTLVPVPVPEPKGPVLAPVLPIAADIAIDAVPSPARVLQERLYRHTASEVRLPHLRRQQPSLPAFICYAVLLWGGVLGGIAGLMVLAS